MLKAKKYAPLVMAMFMSVAFMLGWQNEDVKMEWQHISVTVRTGDTVWGLAEHFKSEHEDIRTVVSRIYEANGLAGKVLKPGQTIVIPVNKKTVTNIVAQAGQ